MLEEASKNGLRIGALKPSLDADRLQRAILYEFPQLSWVGVEIRGTRATIEIVEKILPDKSRSDRRPGNMVAVKDGIIEEILVLSGEAKVAQGDTVRKGDLLISGTIYPEEEGESQGGEGEELNNDKQQKKEPLQVRARGIVRARVWYEVEKEMSLVEEKDRMTGRKRELLILHLAGKEIVLKGKKGNPYKHYRYRKKSWKLPKVGKIGLPAQLVSETYWEVEKEKIYRSMTEARNIAVDRAEADLKGRLKPGTKIMDKKVNIKSLEEKRIRAVLIVEALEDIARFVPIKEN
ncbi:MAG: sporulation protein YqfD [Clostridia bacterium]|nr:sporulation protein YqfD [Clostridia bacterium]